MRTLRPLTFLLLWLSLLSVAFAQPVTTSVAPGLTYTSERLLDGPWEVRELRLDRDAKYLSLDMALGMGTVRGVEPISGIIARETTPDKYVVAGINADFFVMAGDPNAGLVCGLAIKHGELIMTTRGRPAFVLQRDGTPLIGTFETTGAISLPTGTLPLGGLNEPLVKNGACVYTAIFGWPITTGCVVIKPEGLPLQVNGQWSGTVSEIVPAGTAREVKPGEIILSADGTAKAAFAGLNPGDSVRLALQTTGLQAPVEMAAAGNLVLMQGGKVLTSETPSDPRHPRTAIGFNDKQIIIATVDGRQTGWSVGMTYHELALLMQRLGCTDALNLDGGGSTTAWVRGTVVNRPSDGGERRIANALLLRSKAPHGPLARLEVQPQRIVALSGARVPLFLTGVDEWYNPVVLERHNLSVRTQPARLQAALANGTLQLTGEPGSASLQFTARDSGVVLAQVPVRVVRRVAKLALTPARLELCARETASLSAEGLSVAGEPVALPTDALRWSVSGSGLAISKSGVLQALTPGAQGVVRCTLGGLTAEASVAVAANLGFEGFESNPKLVFSTAPESGVVTGQIQVLSDGAAEGKTYCRLTYDLGKPEGTRAAYVRLDRDLGTALRLSLQARGNVAKPVLLRVALVDGNGSRQTFTLAEGMDWGNQWRRVQVRLPAGLKPPLRWESVYVVATDGQTGKGAVDLDDLRVEQVAVR